MKINREHVHSYFNEYFFREILIVSVGLLIALSLQQALSQWSAYRLLHDTRRGLQQEVEANLRLLRHNQQSAARLQVELDTLSSAVDRHRTGSPTPFLSLDFEYHPAYDLVWKTAEDDRAIELMNLREQRQVAERYRLAAQLSANWERVLPHLYEIEAILLEATNSRRGAYTLDDLSAEQLQQLDLSIARAQIAVERYEKNLDSNLRFYDYGEKISRAESE